MRKIGRNPQFKHAIIILIHNSSSWCTNEESVAYIIYI